MNRKSRDLTMRRRSSDKIDEEQVSLECFADHLRQQCGCADVSWAHGNPDPPDYWVTVSGKTFAVEVTSIVDEHSVRCHDQYKRLAAFIEEEARRRRMLSGAYALTVHRQPCLPKSRSSAWQAMMECAFNYVRMTKGLDSEKAVEIIHDIDGLMRIEKVCQDGCFVALAGPFEVKFEGEVIEEMSTLLQHSIHRKRSRLITKGICEHCVGSILLLYHAYGFADIDQVRSAFHQVRDYDWFHTVFLASPIWHALGTPISKTDKHREGHILFSREPTWRPSGSHPNL